MDILLKYLLFVQEIFKLFRRVDDYAATQSWNFSYQNSHTSKLYDIDENIYKLVGLGQYKLDIDLFKNANLNISNKQIFISTRQIYSYLLNYLAVKVFSLNSSLIEFNQKSLEERQKILLELPDNVLSDNDPEEILNKTLFKNLNYSAVFEKNLTVDNLFNQKSLEEQQKILHELPDNDNDPEEILNKLFFKNFFKNLKNNYSDVFEKNLTIDNFNYSIFDEISNN